MFTGIIEEIGHVRQTAHRGKGMEMIFACSLITDGLKEGNSIAVNGVCLTVERFSKEDFSVFASPETLLKSTMANLRSNEEVNLERALKLSNRLGGHFVQGHVDTAAAVVRHESCGSVATLTVRLTGGFERYVAEKGAITLDGVSLTVMEKRGPEVTVALIPETLKRTILRNKHPGTKVNVETDILAKYIESLMQRDGNGLTIDKLKEFGF